MVSDRHRLLGLLEKGESFPEDDLLFQRCVQETMKILDLSFYNVATMFTMSINGVKRWHSGKSAPHPAMRVPVYRAFQNILLGVRAIRKS